MTRTHITFLWITWGLAFGLSLSAAWRGALEGLSPLIAVLLTASAVLLAIIDWRRPQ